jgi:hypothetical protein
MILRRLWTITAVIIAVTWVIRNPESAAQFVRQFFHAIDTLVGPGATG